jgi:phosphonate transport system substrate-binding protein
MRWPAKSRRVFLLFQALIAAMLCSLFAAPLKPAEEPIKIALVPDGLTTEERAPLQAYLTKALGRPITLVTPALYSDTLAGLADGSLDFACLGAVMYVRARAASGVVPLVQRSSDLQFHSVFITGANSSIHALADLKGKQFAFGDINSASGHLIPYRELLEAGIDPATDFKFRYSGSHPLTAALVESGAADAGALDETIFSSMIASGKIDKNKVRVFHTSKPFVDYVYVARKSVPEAQREKFVHALLNLKAGENDSVLKILRAQQFVVANDEEYATIRQIAKKLKLF